MTLGVKFCAVASFRTSFRCFCVSLEHIFVLLLFITEKACSQRELVPKMQQARLWTWRCFAENRVNGFHCCFTDLSAMSEKWLLFPQTYQQLVYLLCSQLFFCYIVLSCTMINLILLLNIIFFCSVNTPNTQVSHLPLRINRNWSIFVEILNTRSLFSFLMKMFMKGFHEQHHALDFQAACVSIASTSLILLIG